MSANQKAERQLAYLRAANEISRRYQALREKLAAEAEQVAALIPKTVEELDRNECIFSNQKEAAARGLTSHAASLELLCNIAPLRNPHAVGAIGAPVAGSEKKASTSNVTGARVADWNETDAGRQMSARLGLNY
jgi:hypothetical protein